MFDALVATLSDTRLEPDLHALLWPVVNVFHRRIDCIERDLDDNESAQRMGQREQDGSEVRSVELERLVAQGLTLIERRNSFEFIRDAAAELYGVAAEYRVKAHPTVASAARELLNKIDNERSGVVSTEDPPRTRERSRQLALARPQQADRHSDLPLFAEPGPEPERDMGADDGPALGDDNMIDFPGARF